MKRLALFLGGIILMMALLCVFRLAVVQNDIQNRPVEISDLADSGYTPQDVYGHGNLVSANAVFGWYIYDEPTPNGRVRKVCVNGKMPQPHMDIDFIYLEEGWYKLRSGTMYLSNDTMRTDPETHKWLGFLSSKIAFNIQRPDLPYRLKIIRDKLRRGSLSPLEYVQVLKASNPSCLGIPAP